MKSQRLSILLIILIAISYTFWIKPQTTKLDAKEAELTQIETEINSLNGDRLSVDADNQGSEIEQALLQEAIPQGFDQDNIISTIKNLADDYQMNLVNLSFNQSFAEQSNQIKSVQITMTANGSPSQTKAFLAALENANRGFFAKNLGLSYGTINEVDLGTLNITIEAYFS